MSSPPVPEPWRPRLPADFLRTAVPLLIVLVGLSVYTNHRNSAFLTSNNFQNILVQSAALGILAVGQTFLIVGGQLDLSVGALVSFTGVLGAYQFVHGTNEWIILVILLLVGAGVGLLWGLIVAYLRVPPFILTLGGMSVLSSLALVISHSRPISVLNAFNSLGFGTWLGLQAPATLLLIVTVVGLFVLHFTRFGRAVYAIGSSEQTAFLAGLPVTRIKVTMFVLNGVLASVAGLVAMARVAAGDPTSGTGLELACIAAVVLGGASLAGGRGTMIGSFIGVLVFGVIDSSLVFLNVVAAWQDFVSGAVLIVAVTITAVSDLRRERRSGRQGSFGRSLGNIVLRRHVSPPKCTRTTGGKQCPVTKRKPIWRRSWPPGRGAVDPSIGGRSCGPPGCSEEPSGWAG